MAFWFSRTITLILSTMKVNLFRKLSGVLALLSITFSLTTSGQSTGNQSVGQWSIYEISLTGPSDGNPYMNNTLDAKFANGSKSVTVPGFYDGNGIYKIRFSPEQLGNWTYVTQSNQSTLSNRSGSFSCVKSTGGRWPMSGIAQQTPAAVAEKSNQRFVNWLKEYIPKKYREAKMEDHGGWFKGHVPTDVIVSWAEWNELDITMKGVHSLDQGEHFFVDKKYKEFWHESAIVKYYPGVGYYIKGYDSTYMAGWKVRGSTVAQLRGDCDKFIDEMANAWAKFPKQNEKLRVIMTTDFPPIGVVKGGNVPDNLKSDPDDMQSMVRFLLYANEFDVEGLVASAGTFAMTAEKKNILSVIDQYQKVYKNLTTHDPRYPTPDYLRSVTYEGKGNNNGIKVIWGKDKQPYTDIIGKGLSSEASNAIIAAADKSDSRPLWIGVWGGPREVAQAIWDVKNTRTEKDLKAFISKLRIFLIAYQDATHGWLMEQFPDLFIIDSRKTYLGMFGAKDPISDLAWVNENIRFNHGPLCDVYPHEGIGCTGVCEGDTPAFLYLVSANRGINNPEDPTQPSWGGQYVRKKNTNHYVDGPGGATIAKWRKDYQLEFKERADWCVKPNAARINLPFKQWLLEYIPAEYPGAKMIDHGGWLQGHVNDKLITNWAEWNEQSITLKGVETHALTNGKNIFIEKAAKTDWVNHPAVTYYDGVGYYIAGYDAARMNGWNVEKCNIVQFDGDGKEFSAKMAKARKAAK